MLYTVMPPALRRDRIILYPGQMAARAPADGAEAVDSVAVRFVARDRRIGPPPVDRGDGNPTWTTPAEGQADGTITAKGPIPEGFFAEYPPHPATPPGAASP
jgi:hypothetical protein